MLHDAAQGDSQQQLSDAHRQSQLNRSNFEGCWKGKAQ